MHLGAYACERQRGAKRDRRAHQDRRGIDDTNEQVLQRAVHEVKRVSIFGEAHHGCEFFIGQPDIVERHAGAVQDLDLPLGAHGMKKAGIVSPPHPCELTSTVVPSPANISGSSLS